MLDGNKEAGCDGDHRNGEIPVARGAVSAIQSAGAPGAEVPHEALAYERRIARRLRDARCIIIACESPSD